MVEINSELIEISENFIEEIDKYSLELEKDLSMFMINCNKLELHFSTSSIYFNCEEKFDELFFMVKGGNVTHIEHFNSTIISKLGILSSNILPLPIEELNSMKKIRKAELKYYETILNLYRKDVKTYEDLFNFVRIIAPSGMFNYRVKHLMEHSTFLKTKKLDYFNAKFSENIELENSYLMFREEGAWKTDNIEINRIKVLTTALQLIDYGRNSKIFKRNK